MNAATLLVLARPSIRVDRTRTAIVAGSVSVALALVLVALAIVAVPPRSWSGGGGSMGDLSSYVIQAGLQPGVIAFVLVATLPVLALALQAIRLGAADRTRRSSALAVAGATPHQLRLVSAARSALPIALGGLLAGPVHVVLWLLLGPALPRGSQFVPGPTGRLVIAWLGAVVVVALVGAALGALDAAPDDPAAPGAPRPGAIAGRVAIAVAGCAVLAGGLLAMNGGARYSKDVIGPAVGTLVVLTLLVVGTAGFAADARRRGLRLHRRGDAVAVLASGRVNADSAVLGRTGGTLLVSGVVLAIGVGLGVELASGRDANTVDVQFFGTGIGATAVVVALAAIFAFASLVMSALDHVLAAQRAFATLAVHGGDDKVVVAAIAAQFAVVAVPALTVGTAVGGLMVTAAYWSRGVGAEEAIVAVALCALTRWAAPALCRMAARTVAPAVRRAMRAEHLRAA